MESLEAGYADAAAKNAADVVKEAKAHLKQMKRANQALERKATMDSITKDNVERRGITNVERIVADEGAHDRHDFLTNDRRGTTFKLVCTVLVTD